MVKLIFIEPSGAEQEVEAPEGWSLMEAAFHNGVDGIEAECGGSCTCATCHVYIDEKFVDKLAPMGSNEDEMLDCAAAERKSNSRLSCQIEITAAFEGMVIQTPDTQI